MEAGRPEILLVRLNCPATSRPPSSLKWHNFRRGMTKRAASDSYWAFVAELFWKLGHGFRSFFNILITGLALRHPRHPVCFEQYSYYDYKMRADDANLGIRSPSVSNQAPPQPSKTRWQISAPIVSVRCLSAHWRWVIGGNQFPAVA